MYSIRIPCRKCLVEGLEMAQMRLVVWFLWNTRLPGSRITEEMDTPESGHAKTLWL